MASLTDTLVRELLDRRHIASLATQSPDGSIHMVAVWFWFDGSHIFVATSSRSRKARNLQSDSRVT
jgi:nitroimidazol reductase NimA-like FMN-containing flavoprotein (pyridoxamine 5'-phosphate oxidase superfamily)